MPPSQGGGPGSESPPVHLELELFCFKGLSKRLIISFKSFSETFYRFKPKSLAFLITSSSTVRVNLILPKNLHVHIRI